VLPVDRRPLGDWLETGISEACRPRSRITPVKSACDRLIALLWVDHALLGKNYALDDTVRKSASRTRCTRTPYQGTITPHGGPCQAATLSRVGQPASSREAFQFGGLSVTPGNGGLPFSIASCARV